MTISSETIVVLRGELFRFALLGFAKTVATALVFYVLAGILPPRLAYTLLYVAGLIVVALMTPRYVFRVRTSHLRIALLLGWYVAIYLVGISVVSLLDRISDSRAVITVGTVFVTAPLSFVGARYFVGKRRLPDAPPALSGARD